MPKIGEGISYGWKAWFWLLAAVTVLGGFGLLRTASDNAAANEALTSGAPQQTVVALWMLQDLITIVIFELMAVVVATASFFVWRGTQNAEPSAETGRHLDDQG